MFCLFRFEKKYELEKLKNQEKRIEIFLEYKNKDNTAILFNETPLKPALECITVSEQVH